MVIKVIDKCSSKCFIYSDFVSCILISIAGSRVVFRTFQKGFWGRGMTGTRASLKIVLPHRNNTARKAGKEHVSASTQNQALCGLLFLYRYVLNREIGDLGEVIRARKPTRAPVVMTREEVKAILNYLKGDKWLMASLMYGAGLRSVHKRKHENTKYNDRQRPIQRKEDRVSFHVKGRGGIGDMRRIHGKDLRVRPWGLPHN